MIKNNQIIGVILFAIGCIAARSDENISKKGAVMRDNLDTITYFMSSTERLKSKYIPDSVFRTVHLKDLSINGMDCDYKVFDSHGNDITQCWMITEIPAQIKKLTELETLQLNINAISEIPLELTELKHLKLLDLDDNLNLSDIENIVGLTNLETLSLNGCNITKLPVNIGQLKKLKSLGLAGNHVDEVEKARIKKALPNCSIYF